MMENNFESTVEQKDSWIVLSFKGRIDGVNASQAETAAVDTLKNANKLAIDMGELKYLSSAGLRVFLRVEQIASEAGKKFVFCGMRGSVKDILRESGMIMLFENYETEDDLP